MMRKFNETFSGWSILWKYLSGYRKELIILSALGVVSAITNGTVPYVAGKFFDAISKPSTVFTGTQHPIPLWIMFLSVWGVFQLVAIVVDWVSDIKNERFATRIFVGYFTGAISSFLFFSKSFHTDRKTGELTNKMQRAGDSLFSITKNVVTALAPQFLSITVGLGFTFYMNARFSVILLGGIILYVFMLARTVPQTVPLQRKVNRNWNDAYEIIYEAIANIMTVKQFTAELFEERRMKNLFARAISLDAVIQRIWSSIIFSHRAIVFTTQLAIFILSVFAIRAGTMTLGELLAFNGYAAMVFGPFVILGHHWQTLQNGLVALERAEKILLTPTEDYTPKESMSPKETHGAIEFKNVSFAYKKRNKVLQNVSFTVHSGEVVALVGESGAGKSTLIDLISAYYFPAKGIVTIDGVPTTKWNLHALRGMIAIVPQEVSLFNDTLEKNLAYGPKKHTKVAIMRAVREAHANVFIEKLPKKYAQMVGERGIKLSVGQKQRIAIARAILRNPKILILDEPTSALDSETEKYVTEALDRVMEGRTTFIIAHRLSTVRKADKILVLEGGKIIESGNHDELMQIEGGSYRRRYELHVGLV